MSGIFVFTRSQPTANTPYCSMCGTRLVARGWFSDQIAILNCPVCVRVSKGVVCHEAPEYFNLQNVMQGDHQFLQA